MRYLAVAFFIFSTAFVFQNDKDTLRDPGEKHLKNMKQLTFGGQNAEAYFSFNEKKIVYQSAVEPYKCDQIFTMNLDGSNKKLISTGKGRTTCSFFLPGDSLILYASTHLGGDKCPPQADRKKGYVWALYPDYDIFVTDTNGKIVQRLTDTPGYDAEAVVSPKDDKIVFTSIRSGDLEIYSMNLDGSNVKQLTDELGYDGGPFFSWDGKKIVYRAYHPKTEKEISEYKELISEQMIKPMNLQIMVMDLDGSNKQQLTFNAGANFGPFWHPDGKHIIFSSNFKDTSRIPMNFDLFMIDAKSKNIEQITFSNAFDGFPMFTHDGKKLIFASNRFGKVRGETNVFIADWIH
jgi:TolB protein